MGLNIIAQGISAEDSASHYSTQVSRGLEGIFFTNTSVDKAIKNYAKDKPNAVAMGAIAVGENETSFKSRSHWIDTGIKDVLNATYIFIAKTNDQSATTSQRGAFISAYDANAADKGLHIGVAATTASMFYTNSTGESAPLSLDPPFSTSAHKLYVVRLGANNIDFKCLTDSVSAVASVASSARKPTNRNLLLGSSVSAHFFGTAEMMAVRLHSVALTDSEVEQAASELRRYALSRGITV